MSETLAKVQGISISAKLILNVHDLNNEATAGNVSDIRMIDYVDLEGNRHEAPAVSGRMLKHCHFEAMRQLALQEGLPLCAGCQVGEPIRPAVLEDGEVKQVARSTADAIKACALCDVHGYLIAQAAKEETAENGTRKSVKGQSLRRTSTAMFSWLLPSLQSDTPSKQVVHTRVVKQAPEEKKQDVTQMIFYKSYAAGIYAFVSVLDAGRIGLVDETGANVFDADQWQHRVLVAIEAYRALLSGRLGASLSHAIPHCDCTEALAVVSPRQSIPFPISPIYQDYATKYTALLPPDETTRVFCFGLDDPPRNAEKVQSPGELINKVIEYVKSV